MAIELVPLCTMRLTAKPPIEIGAGPAGIRMIFEETSVEVHGDRLRGQLEGSASDCARRVPVQQQFIKFLAIFAGKIVRITILGQASQQDQENQERKAARYTAE